MKRMLSVLLLLVIAFHQPANACTIVAVSGRVTADGRPLLLKNRDSNTWDIKMKIGQGSRYVYLCQCKASDGSAYCGYNEVGFAIINAKSENMPTTPNNWNALYMQKALENCATVDEFEHFLDTISKPMNAMSNYGVMDAQGNVAIFEVGSGSYVRYNADDTESGYLIRTNFSFSQDTTNISSISSTSLPRYQIASSYMENVIATHGSIAKEDLFALTRYLVNEDGENLLDLAPFDENTYTPVEIQYYIPRYYTTSAMIIQGLLPNESPDLTVAWTMMGPPLVSVMVPYLITCNTLPQKAMVGTDGHSWFCYIGHELKNVCFVDNPTLNLAKLYNLSGTGIMQKVMQIEEEILQRGNNIVEELRVGTVLCSDVENYYAWVDNYMDEQIGALVGVNEYDMEMNDIDSGQEQEVYYYDILGRRVRNVRPDAIIKRKGKIGIILN